VSEDRWGRPFKHPYEIHGFTGTIESDLMEKLDRFTRYQESEEARAELNENSKKHVGAWDSSTIERLAPKLCSEIREVLGPQGSMVWQFNVQTGPDEYVRYFAVFKQPETGVRRVTRIGQAVSYLGRWIQARFLNLRGSWMDAPYPTFAELQAADEARTKVK
jgi:hypothetical protein